MRVSSGMLFGLSFAGFGALLCGLVGWLAYSELAYQSRSIRLDATVVALDLNKGKGGRACDFWLVWDDESGLRRLDLASTTNCPAAGERPQQVAARLDPQSPRDIQLDETSSTWVVVAILGSIGALFLVLGLAFTWACRKEAPDEPFVRPLPLSPGAGSVAPPKSGVAFVPLVFLGLGILLLAIAATLLVLEEKREARSRWLVADVLAVDPLPDAPADHCGVLLEYGETTSRQRGVVAARGCPASFSPGMRTEVLVDSEAPDRPQLHPDLGAIGWMITGGIGAVFALLGAVLWRPLRE